MKCAKCNDPQTEHDKETGTGVYESPDGSAEEYICGYCWLGENLQKEAS